MKDVVIRVDGIGKRYRLGATLARKHGTLGDALARGVRRFGRTLAGRRDEGQRARHSEEFWALKDVSLEVRRSEVVGLIGPNGAGKSTLLKILSRITTPTEGRGVIRGRVGSLLEVGTGFHQELTGRENIVLNGAILGMTRREVESKFDEIVAFSGVEQFIDTPVKRYSTGMYLRLAFAVAAHLEPDVLIVDEVLAVGDAAFQKKCLGKMSSVAGEGRTVVFVSHNMDAVQRLCTRAVMLRHGGVVADGSVRDVVTQYLSSTGSRGAPAEWIELGSLPHSGSGEIRIAAVKYASPSREVGFLPYPYGALEVEMAVEASNAIAVPSFIVAVRNQSGTPLIRADVISQGKTVDLAPGRNLVRFRIEQLFLMPGIYVVDLWAGTAVGTAFDHVENAFELEVVSGDVGGFGVTPKDTGVVPCEFEFLGPKELENGDGHRQAG